MVEAFERFVDPDSKKLRYSYGTRMMLRLPLPLQMKDQALQIKNRLPNEQDFFVEENYTPTQTNIMRIMNQATQMPDNRRMENYTYSTVFDFGTSLIASAVAPDKENISVDWREDQQFHFLFRSIGLVDNFTYGVPEIDWLYLDEIGKNVIKELDTDFSDPERIKNINSDRLLRDAVQLHLLSILYAENHNQARAMLHALYKKMSRYSDRLLDYQNRALASLGSIATEFAGNGHTIIGFGLPSDFTTAEFFRTGAMAFSNEEGGKQFKERRQSKKVDHARRTRVSEAAVAGMFKDLPANY